MQALHFVCPSQYIGQSIPQQKKKWNHGHMSHLVLP